LEAQRIADDAAEERRNLIKEQAETAMKLKKEKQEALDEERRLRDAEEKAR